MGSRVSQTGGTQAGQLVSNGFNQYLNSQLNGSGFNNSMQQQQNGGQDFSGANNFLQNFFQNQQNGNNAQFPNMMQSPMQQGQGQSGMGGRGQNFGSVDPSLINVRNMDSIPQGPGSGGQAPPMTPAPNGQNSGNNTFPTFANPYQAPTYNNPQLNPNQTNMGAGQTGQIDMNQFQQAPQSNFNTQQGMGGQNYGANSGYDGMLQSLIQQNANRGAGGGFQAGTIGAAQQLAPAANIDANSPAIQATLQHGQNQHNRAIADMRARFGAAGAGSMGTGAQYAEALANAEFAPQQAMAANQIINQAQQQDLAERSTSANVAMGNRGQDASLAAANSGNSVQAMLGQGSNNNSMLNSLLNASATARGQDINTGLGNRGYDVNQIGMGLQQSMGNQAQGNQFIQSLMSGTLQNQNQGNNWMTGLNAQNSQNNQNNNVNNLNASGQQNGFNMNNAQNQAQFGLGTNQLNSQNWNANNQNNQAMTGLGLQQNQQQNQNVQQMLQMLFGGFQQANGLNTAQAQTTVTPNPWMQAVGMLGNAAGSYFGAGGRLPGMGNNSPAPTGSRP